MLGLGTRGKTFENLERTGECVLNLPSSAMVSQVDRLALTTGKNPVPEYKTRMGFRYVADKFALAGLTADSSETVRPPRVVECPVQLEAVIENLHTLGSPDDFHAAIEARVVRVHVEESILNDEKRHYIDTDKWKPLIMSFCEFYGLGEKVYPSRLAKVF
jgi:flavin reductase (DIM6/NTAB) family NADH-FMN oxidoreductase RutF